MIVVNGTEVLLAQARRREPKLGDVDRVLSNKLRTDTTGVVRVISFTTIEMTKTEADALMADLRAAGTVPVTGGLVDDESPAPEFWADELELNIVGPAAWVISGRLSEAEP